MLLTPHILVGALIGFKIQNPWLVFILAIISHFALDAIPHREYDIKALKKKKIDKQFVIEFFQVQQQYFLSGILPQETTRF